MAKTQSRRSVSLNRRIYDAAADEAARRGVPLAGLVEAALGAFGVPVVVHPQQPLALAQANAARRAESVARLGGRNRKPRPSRTRKLLGDRVADACGVL
jgi:hypothetical protein